MIKDPYKTLNLPHTATEAQVKKAYRQLARKYHPDTFSQPCFSDAEKQQATAKFAEISAAHALLTDERSKAEYDRTYKYQNNENDEKEEPSGSFPGTKRQQQPPKSTPYRAAPPPPPRGGWIPAVDPVTGRTYFYNSSTGQSVWQIPSSTHSKKGGIPPPPPPLDYQYMQDTPSDASRRPDNHQCSAFCSLLLCPPIGMIAVYHSVCIDRCWRQGLYGESINHARQAPKYACLGNVLGIGFWIYWIFIRENEFDFEWPDFNFD